MLRRPPGVRGERDSERGIVRPERGGITSERRAAPFAVISAHCTLAHARDDEEKRTYADRTRCVPEERPGGSLRRAQQA
jgi:hypothetical protein